MAPGLGTVPDVAKHQQTDAVLSRNSGAGKTNSHIDCGRRAHYTVFQRSNYWFAYIYATSGVKKAEDQRLARELAKQLAQSQPSLQSP